MRRYLKLYYHFLRYNIMQMMAYKADFVTWSFVTIGWIIFTLIFYQLLFTNIDNIAGWSKAQMLVLQGFYFIIDAILWGVFYENFYDLPYKINLGTLDLELVKPINKQFLLSFQKIGLNQINSLILGMLIIGYGLRLGEIHPSLLNILFALSMLAIATVFLYSGWFITICTAFWFDRLENIVYIFPGLRDFAKIPIPAYQGLVKIFLTYVIPITLVTNLPSQFLFGQQDFVLVGVLAASAISLLVFSHYFFQIALKRYSGASS